MSKATFTIDAANLANLQERIAKIARRAARLGCAAVTLAVVAAYVVRRTFERADGETFTRCIPVVDVVIEGDAPRVEGFELIATVEHTAAGNIIRTVPTAEVAEGALVAYRHADANCDHCDMRRRRNDTFIVREVATGAYRQIGRNCLCDYLGGHDPAAAVALAELQIAAAGMAEGEGEYGYGAGNVDGADVAEYLCYVAASIRLHGWTSRGNARRYDTLATADDALNALWPWMGKHPNGKPTADDAAVAQSALEYTLADLEAKGDARNDYQQNLWVALQGYVTHRSAGFVASVISYAQRGREREVERQQQAKHAAASKHVGSVKERLTFRAVVERKSWFEGAYGVTHIYKFRDSDGNALTWFASRDQGVEIGDTVRLTGTVKKHDEYRGEAQTVLTRCKVAPAS